MQSKLKEQSYEKDNKKTQDQLHVFPNRNEERKGVSPQIAQLKMICLCLQINYEMMPSM